MGVLRHRALALFLVCVSLTCLCVLLVPSQRGHTLHQMVRETVSRELSHVIQSDSDSSAQSLLAADPTLLALLVTAVAPGQSDLALGWLRSAQHWLGGESSQVSILVWDLGLGRYERETVARQCNITTMCSLVQFSWAQWPRHVRELRSECYRPLVLQSVLRDHQALVWLDLGYRLTHGDLSDWLVRARERGGVMAWPEREHLLSPAQAPGQRERSATVPTTALTHPKMFQYFDPRRYEDYAFQHMVSLASLILYRGERVTRELMAPWIQCVLTEHCINPIGAQDSGCRWDKKPQFRYSGCHRYDVSAFNIVLGQVFSFRESEYLGGREFFRKVDQESQGTGNTTTTTRTKENPDLEQEM